MGERRGAGRREEGRVLLGPVAVAMVWLVSPGRWVEEWVRCWGGMGVPLSQSCAGGAPICGGLSAEEWVVSRARSTGWAELSADYIK